MNISTEQTIPIFGQTIPNEQHMQCIVNNENYNIYDGIFTKKVKLACIKPSKIIKTDEVILQLDNDSKMNALKYRHPLKYLGSLYNQIVVPCTPAYELSVNKIYNKTMQETEKVQQTFAIKVCNQTEVINQTRILFNGIASGKRSAVLRDETNRLLRLKGCGNNCQGFPRQNNQSRGHHFYHTAKRQLFITKHINKILKQKLQINPPANQPLYMFDYPQEAIRQLNLANHLPLINKYCCVFKTQGDRRVGTHLISPLQIIFMNLVNHGQNNWQQKFLAKSRYEDRDPIDLITNFQLFVNPGEKFLTVYDYSKQISNYITISQHNIIKFQNYKQIFFKIINKFVPQCFREFTNKLLLQINFDKFDEICQIILSKIGFQIGQIKRAMCENEISWGFYLDHGFQWHCNAHLNNFIVTQPKSNLQNSNYFILPLDFDLAYTSKQFICIDLDSQSYGNHSEQVFQNYLCGQFSAMEMSLFGLELMNFKYGIESEEVEQKQKIQSKKMTRIVFRDTLVSAFNSGMRNKKQFGKLINKKWDLNIESIKNLIEACLYISMEFNT